MAHIFLCRRGGFLADPNKYINNAYDKSEYDGYGWTGSLGKRYCWITYGIGYEANGQ